MSETTITVQGSSWIEHAPEQATVRVSISHDGAARQGVFDATTEVAETLGTALRGLHHPTGGPVVSWSSDRISVWSDRPWNNEGLQLPLVYHAIIGVQASFTDFDALAGWVERVATTSGVTVGSLEWELFDATRDALLAQVRAEAVQDAAEKALIYARAAGLTSVRATAIADPGMLGVSDSGGNDTLMLAGAPRMLKATSSIEFTPAELRVSAVVDARFLAN
ncbi:MAG: SIMPL domain-containing protein [Pseudolysinimonas sp.]